MTLLNALLALMVVEQVAAANAIPPPIAAADPVTSYWIIECSLISRPSSRASLIVRAMGEKSATTRSISKTIANSIPRPRFREARKYNFTTSPPVPPARQKLKKIPKQSCKEKDRWDQSSAGFTRL
jgi:hypothetical protein